MSQGMRAPRLGRVGSGSTHQPVALGLRGTANKTTALIQRGRMSREVADVDLHTVMGRLGPYHETTWYFRQAQAEARKCWERLCQEVGERLVAEALQQPPCTMLELGDSKRPETHVRLILIQGGTYRLESITSTPLAPVICRLTRLSVEPELEPYYALRQADGATQCDCAEWVYRIAETDQPRYCKHLAALHALGWL